MLVLPVLWRFAPSQYDIEATFKSIGDGFEKAAREREVERCAIRFRHMVRSSKESNPECKKMMEAWEVEERCGARNIAWADRGALPRGDECFNEGSWRLLKAERERKEHEAMKARIEAEVEAWAKKRDEAWKAEDEKWKRLLQGFER